jgi:hypothetical protein
MKTQKRKNRLKALKKNRNIKKSHKKYKESPKRPPKDN